MSQRSRRCKGSVGLDVWNASPTRLVMCFFRCRPFHPLGRATDDLLFSPSCLLHTFSPYATSPSLLYLQCKDGFLLVFGLTILRISLFPRFVLPHSLLRLSFILSLLASCIRSFFPPIALPLGNVLVTSCAPPDAIVNS